MREVTGDNALRRLQEIIAAASKERMRRAEETLCEPDRVHTHAWFMCVPRCFNSALDIRCTVRVTENGPRPVWTQGANFAFDVGDVVYDSEDAYGTWLHALRVVRLAFQVVRAKPVVPATAENPRSAGLVQYAVFRPNRERSRLVPDEELVESSQDDFVRTLIAGERETHGGRQETQMQLL